MSLDDKFMRERSPYEPLGIPFLKLAEEIKEAESFARLMHAEANMYSRADNPEIYPIAQEAEENAENLRTSFRQKYY